MGNTNTKESRGSEIPFTPRNHEITGAKSQSANHDDRDRDRSHTSRSERGSRNETMTIGVSLGSNSAGSERRESKQEREAKKLEKERQIRIVEREKSLREENVDGGYLVTMGIYTGIEDFNKVIVRKLIIERKMAPFWRGLNEISDAWTENQLIAACRGLPIPASDDVSQGKNTSDISSNTLIAEKSSQEATAQKSLVLDSTLSDTFTIPSIIDTFPDAVQKSPLFPSSPTLSSSLNRTQPETLVPLTNPSQNSFISDYGFQEVYLPNDPYINGKAIEVFLYSDTVDCPICFLSYPQYLNKTRCCDQPMCSECFVQIKRPEPHPPEHHDNDLITQRAAVTDLELLVSEPACCPYCQQPDFGVTYEPPSFRRGLSSTNIAEDFLELGYDASTSLSFNSGSMLSPSHSPNPQKRRTYSLSADAQTVVTIDRIRPDWAIKLANARSHLARKSAAATALHTAAYLMNNPGSDNRSFAFRSNRMGRGRSGDSPSASGNSMSAQRNDGNGITTAQDHKIQTQKEQQLSEAQARRNRVRDIEELMMVEAIRLSLATEEERKKNAEKEAAKEAKKIFKEVKKREKKERKSVYGGVGGSASGSALSVNLPRLGKRRGNSVASIFHREVIHDDTEGSQPKGKAVDCQPTGILDSFSPTHLTRANTTNWIPHPTRNLENQTSTIADEKRGTSPLAIARRFHPLKFGKNSSTHISTLDDMSPSSLPNHLDGRGFTPSFDTTSINGKFTKRDSTSHLENAGNIDPEFKPKFQSIPALMSEKSGLKTKRGTPSLNDESSQQSSYKSRQASVEDNISGRKLGISTSYQVDKANIVSGLSDVIQDMNPQVIITPGSPEQVGDGGKGEQQLCEILAQRP
ncbi:BgtA-20845 [Blumeria graminis f. sp. tritici]|uniref:BgtA-20845 n=2 Tax=Blumeria graminis f. sp. tritici TaxID=62690 RepID=A0A9X9MPF1_BLUGR|nr:hypothetical protein BGT96224_A20845 [Blumeria graminis f. sp. tritici 96224]VDB95041.1 BgtA-20845 [Blumeria graminis f. sp. tritici]